MFLNTRPSELLPIPFCWANILLPIFQSRLSFVFFVLAACCASYGELPFRNIRAKGQKEKEEDLDKVAFTWGWLSSRKVSDNIRLQHLPWFHTCKMYSYIRYIVYDLHQTRWLRDNDVFLPPVKEIMRSILRWGVSVC